MKQKELIFWFRSFALEQNTDAQHISKETLPNPTLESAYPTALSVWAHPRLYRSFACMGRGSCEPKQGMAISHGFSPNQDPTQQRRLADHRAQREIASWQGINKRQQRNNIAGDTRAQEGLALPRMLGRAFPIHFPLSPLLDAEIWLHTRRKKRKECFQHTLCSIASDRPTPKRLFLASYTDNLLVEVKESDRGARCF